MRFYDKITQPIPYLVSREFEIQFSISKFKTRKCTQFCRANSSTSNKCEFRMNSNMREFISICNCKLHFWPNKFLLMPYAQHCLALYTPISSSKLLKGLDSTNIKLVYFTWIIWPQPRQMWVWCEWKTIAQYANQHWICTCHKLHSKRTLVKTENSFS